MGQLIWSLWGHYMALSSAAILLDGAFWSLLYNYPTLDQFRGTFLFNGVSFPGIFSIFFGMFTIIIEKKMSLPVGVKAMFYLLVAANGLIQFSTIIGGQCFLCTSIVHMFAAFTGETGNLSIDRKAKEEASRGEA